MNGPSMSMEWFGSDAVVRNCLFKVWRVGRWRTSQLYVADPDEAKT